jgi:hypothetical protein
MESARFAYQAYLLRLWRVEATGHVTWRASLQSVDTGKQRGFEDLEALIGFLRQIAEETGEDEPGAEISGDTGMLCR